MWDEKSFLWVESKEGADREMELAVRLVDGKKMEAEVCLRLVGADGYCLEKAQVLVDGEAVFACPGVKLWDPEHPWLYGAEITVKGKDGRELSWEQKVGFRVLERKGKQLLWNHRALKLKGVCYRERKEDWEGTKRDLVLFAGANVNFLRSIYAPFSPQLLALCDEMGFLVEDTAPFYEIGQTKTATQDLPHCKEEFLVPVQEMLAGGSHVSILIWSLGHDCAWGANFREAAQLVRSVDIVRPLTFHLPMSIPEEDTKIDIWPMHYIDWKQPFDVCFDQMVIFHTPGEENEIGYMTAQADEYDVPVLHEVWSPVACHNRDEIQHDPAIRRFWGESIVRFAEKSLRTKGCLGGAVLAGVDEDGSFEGMGQYEWGVLDKYHNPKPEYAALRKAYAPVALKLEDAGNGRLRAEVENRFLFTDLSECRIIVNGEVITGIALEGQPGSTVNFEIEKTSGGQVTDVAVEAKDGSRRYVESRFESGAKVCGEDVAGSTKVCGEDAEGCADVCVDETSGWTDTYGESANHPSVSCVKQDPLNICWSQDGATLTISNSVYEFVFSAKTCLLERACAAGGQLLAGGPYLNSTGLLTGRWTGKKLIVSDLGGRVQVTIEGSYENVLDIRFLIQIAPDGTVDTAYEVLKLYRHMPHTVKAEIGMCPGGLNEKGVAYLTADGAQSFAWTGKECGSKPVSSDEIWSSFHDVDSACLTFGQGGKIMIQGQGENSVRLQKAPEYTPEAVVDDRDARMHFEGNWHRMDDYCGNYGGTETLSREAGDIMKLCFEGTGVRLYGPLDINYGLCDIFLDGVAVAENVSQYPDKVDFPGMSRGYEKRYGQLLFEVHDLPQGEHELMVKVAGKAVKGAQNTYTAIDYAVIESESCPVGIRLNVNQDYNYTRLVRGCYKRPKVELIPGVRESFRMKLVPGQE